jgi:hypothetical protein
MCAVFLLGRRLYAFLERLVSDDVRAGARCNGTFSETCEIPRLNAKKSLMNPSQYFFSYRIRNFVTPIIESVRTPAGITPYPTGRPSFGAASQALRARLRSHRPSGTFRNRHWLEGAKFRERSLSEPSNGSKSRPTRRPFHERTRALSIARASPLGSR